jgi:RNA polymerase sigma factor (sigma-70 family)
MPIDDRDLVIQSAHGDVHAFGQLIGKYSNAVYAVAYARLDDFHYAEDVSQDVFVKAWYSLGTLDDPNKFGSWLTSIARNSASDWARKLKPTLDFMDHNLGSVSSELTEEQVIRHENNQAVQKALNGLEEKHRLVAIMYFISGFNTREISKLLGIGLSAVESRLRRSKEKLKKELFELAEQMMVTQKLGKEFTQKVVQRIVGVSCLNFPVSNVEISAEWYVKHLGCILVRRPIRGADGGMNAIIKIGEDGPSVFLHEELERTPLHFIRNGKPASLFELRTMDIEAFYLQLKEEGVKVGERYDNEPCSKYFDVCDPDGNTISIAEWY